MKAGIDIIPYIQRIQSSPTDEQLHLRQRQGYNMDILHKFSNIRGRSHTTSADVPRRPTADEWYIPYTGRISPSPQSQAQTYEKQPKSHRTSQKSASHSNLLSLMCGGGLGDVATLKHHGRGNRRGQEDFVNPAAGTHKYHSRHQKGALSTSALSPSSHSNKSHHSVLSPSYTSVPTGLAESNILFSPLNRQLRASAEVPRDDTPRYARSSYFDRTMSSSYRSKHQRDNNPYTAKEEPRQWQPRSSSRHDKRSSIGSLATMTTSDDPEKVLENGKARMREREEWTDYVERRGRSISLDRRAEPPLGVLPIGNAKAREKERSRSRERGKSNTIPSLSLGIVQVRKRSKSLGSRWTWHSRGSSASEKDNYKKDHNRELLGSTASEKPSDVFNSVPHHRSKSEVIQGLYTQGHARSHPNLLSSFASNNPSHKQPAASGSGPSLHFKQPLVADRDLVVVIGRGASTQKGRTMQRTNNIMPPLDLSKPLPDLPPEADLLVTPRGLPVSPALDSIGVAISPDTGSLRGSEAIQAAMKQVDTPSSAIASTDIGLALSPLSPVNGISRTAPESLARYSQGSSTARAFLAKQHQRARLKRAFQSPLQSPSGYRRQEDNRPPVKPLAVSTSTDMGNENTTATSETFAAANNSSGVLPIPSPVPINGYTYARERKTAASVGVKDEQAKQAVNKFSGANEMLCCKSDAGDAEKELDPKSDDSPSTTGEDEGFQGLFFQTPLGPQTTSSLSSRDTSSLPSDPYAQKTNSPGQAKHSTEQGLSQGNFCPVSEGSDGTYMEITTPEMPLNDQALAASDVMSSGTKRLLAPITIGKPLDIRPRKTSAQKNGGSEEAANSFKTFSAQDTPSTPLPPVSVSTESMSAPLSPSLPESGTIPALNPSILPSPVFPVSHQRYLVNPEYPSYSLNFPSPQQKGRSPSWTPRRDSRSDVPLSPLIGDYRDSVAVSFVDKFPSPPQRYQHEDETEERIYNPMRATPGIDP
ncbi:uncharacterized protein IAS62_003302 [Cryptococcus decagattii]|uniref:Uncharacterized protein n=1 Tax=Cryptococcus decagattii TaxID=1859122 RepID=A0ABZ2ATZ3_9TREE